MTEASKLINLSNKITRCIMFTGRCGKFNRVLGAQNTHKYDELKIKASTSKRLKVLVARFVSDALKNVKT